MPGGQRTGRVLPPSVSEIEVALTYRMAAVLAAIR
jgi:hypothetical protein